MPKFYKPMRIGPRVSARILGTDAQYQRTVTRPYDPATGTIAGRAVCTLIVRGQYEDVSRNLKHDAPGSEYLHSEANRTPRIFTVSAEQFRMDGKEFMPQAGDVLTVPAPRTSFQEDYPTRRFSVVGVGMTLVNERAVEFTLDLEDA